MGCGASSESPVRRSSRLAQAIENGDTEQALAALARAGKEEILNPRFFIPGGRKFSVPVLGEKALKDDLKKNKPVVMALATGSGSLLRSVKMENYYEDEDTAKEMEVQTGPAREGPWTTVLAFTSAQTTQPQTFGAAANAPLLAGFVRVVVHSRAILLPGRQPSQHDGLRRCLRDLRVEREQADRRW